MKRALVSVTNKEGIVEFCKGLEELGFEIVSTGGTLKKLTEAGVKAIAIDDVTGFPEMLDGRVKTLHPMVHGGLLFRRDLESHVKTVQEYGIHPIDLVCVNLYEFEKALKANKPMAEMIENIDIGGPSMIRSAAKNFKDVLIVTDTNDYEKVLEAIKTNTDDYNFRLNLAYKAFSITASYDSIISRYFANVTNDEFPEILNVTLKKEEHLRYGENSQQQANRYVDPFVQKSLLDYEQLHGKEISFNNLNDLYGAVALVREFDNQTVTAAIKHSTPCGVAIGKTGYESYMKAYEADPQSIFGGIVAVNYKVDKATATEMHKIFLEIVAAPDFDDDALEVLKQKKNLRILKLNNLTAREAKYDIKYLEGKVLVQNLNTKMIDEMKVVTNAKPTLEQMTDMEFIQFHPTALYHPGDRPSYLITEAMRGYGGILKTKDGKEFMQKYDPRLSLAPRDIVARAIDNEMKLRGEEHVYLDVTHKDPEETKKHFPNIYKKCLSIGIDITKDYIPVAPAAHYLCGGIKVDLNGRSSINRLYAIGECSCTGLHGGNRLASNSLIEAVVYADAAAKHSLSIVDRYDWNEDIPEWDAEGTMKPEELVLITQSMKEVNQIMEAYVGIVRSNIRLIRAWNRLDILYEETERLFKRCKASRELCELRNMINIGYLITRQAMERKESRGLHYTIDYPPAKK